MRTLLISMALAFAAVYFITPQMIKFLIASGIVGTDVHKKGRPKIAEMGGPAVLVGFLAGVFFYIAVKVFLYGGIPNLIEIFAAVCTALIVSIVGMLDDIGSLMKRTGLKRVGVRRRYKVLFPLVAAIPLISILAGHSVVTVPLVGTVDLGLIYPLLIVPLIVMGMSNAFDMVAGMNGLEAGLGAVYLGGLGIFTFISGNESVALIAFCGAAALLAFLKYNWYPARIMAGDSLVYFVGATAAAVVVLGNIERFALIAFAPWIIELLLKLRVKLDAENFGVLQKDGTLKSPYRKVYSLTSLFMRLGRFNEKQVVAMIIMLEVLFVALAFLLSVRFVV